jgi:hypothetical protein
MPGVKLRGAVVGPPKSMAGHGLSEDSWDMLAYRKWNIIKTEYIYIIYIYIYMESLKLGSMPFHIILMRHMSIYDIEILESPCSCNLDSALTFLGLPLSARPSRSAGASPWFWFRSLYV